MATRFSWTPENFDVIGETNYPQIRTPASNGTLLVAAYDATTDELAKLKGIAPQGLTGTMTLVVYGFMVSGNSGTIGLRAEVEAVTPGDSLNRNTTRSFDSINYQTSATVPGTAGYPFATTITLTNNDSLAAGDEFTIRLGRDADGTGTTDSAAGDFYCTGAELRDGA